MLPFSGVLKTRSADALGQEYNQLAAAFFRIAPVRAAFELYGEFLRDDHNADLRDLVGEPDHESAYTVGVRRVWGGANQLREITIEHTNGRITHLARIRGESPMYVHSGIGEGHTFQGQLLGSTATLGGRGLNISFRSFSSTVARDITVETRALSQSVEGGTLNGLATAVHTVRIDQPVQRLYGAAITGELRLVHGIDRRMQLVLGVTFRN